MKSCFFEYHITKQQTELYSQLKEFSKKNRLLGRLGAIPVALVDVALETLKSPLKVIESLAMVAVNLFGAAFSSKCKVKDVIYNFQAMLNSSFDCFVAFLLATSKVVYQIFLITFNPEKAESICYSPLPAGDFSVIHD